MNAFMYSLLFAMQISLIYSAYPRFVTKCNLWDTGCLVNQIQRNVPSVVDGILELGTEVLDPMHIDYLHIDKDGLRMDISDIVIRGYGKARVQKAEINPFLKQIHLVYNVDLTMDSKYNAGGNLFGLPIVGDGDMRIKSNNIQIESIVPFDVVQNARGQYIIDLKEVQYWLNFNEDPHFELTNLFNGDKQLSDNMHRFINNNSKFVSITFSRPLFDKANEKIYKALRAYLRNMPLEDAFKFL